MILYTIGFTKKSAKEFFDLLNDNHIKRLIDIRLNNASQLAGFTKGNDLSYFMDEICKAEYIHDIQLAPTKEILDNYKSKEISWEKYEQLFIELLNQRKTYERLSKIYNNDFDKSCLLCSELTADKCHRRLVAEFIQRNCSDTEIEIVHL